MNVLHPKTNKQTNLKIAQITSYIYKRLYFPCYIDTWTKAHEALTHTGELPKQTFLSSGKFSSLNFHCHLPAAICSCLQSRSSIVPKIIHGMPRCNGSDGTPGLRLYGSPECLIAQLWKQMKNSGD